MCRVKKLFAQTETYEGLTPSKGAGERRGVWMMRFVFFYDVGGIKMIEEIEAVLKDYFWMKREIERLEKIIYGYATPMKSWGVAQYGIEAAMPKGSKGKSQAELLDMDIREDRQYRRLLNLRDRVFALEMAVDLLDNDKNRVIYDCILSGMAYREISKHLGLSKDQVRTSKKDILAQLGQNGQFLQLLQIENIV